MSVLVRVLAAATVVLFTCSAVASLQERSGAPSASLESFVNETRLGQRLPGLAVVTVRSDGQPRVYMSGERRIGKGDPIAPADRMHLGSLTKAITATVIGALAEQRRMTLETTIGQAFPELSAKTLPAYRDVSVRQLLGHAGGVSPYRTRESLQWMLALNGTATEQRYALLERVLAEPPRFEPGTRHEYSNAGGAIAGAMAERIGGSPYRQLVQELVFAPLGGHAAFGNPGLAATPQPWGHTRTILDTVTEVTPDNAVYTTPLAIEPAGDVSLSPQDYGRFLQLHLRGLRGRDDVLKATTIQDLHRRVAPIEPSPGSAMGWSIMPRDGVQSHEHVGSYGAYVAYATIQPSRDVAVGIFANLGGGQDVRDAVGRAALQIAARLSTDAAFLLAAALQAAGPADLARAASEEFAQARFTALIARFNAQMKAAATEEALQTALNQITGKVGAFERVDGNAACKDAGPMRLCLTPLLFERARVTLQIAVDGDGLIAGLVIAGIAPRDGAATPPAASVRPPHSNVDVTTTL